MPPALNLPGSLLGILSALRPCFTAPSFVTFCGLVAGLAGQTRRRTVTGMLLGACLHRAWPHDRAHYFFTRARWEIDQLGLGIAQVAVLALVPPGADLRVAVDDSVFRRSGRKVHGAAWQHDGSSPSLSKLSYGNCFVAVALLVTVPFCSREIGLPVLVRLHVPEKKNMKAKKGTASAKAAKGAAGKQAATKKTAAEKKRPSKVDTAAALVTLLANAFPDRTVHAVADAAYHGPALRALPGNVTWTCRIPRNARLYAPAPPRTGKRGRPWTKGACLGEPRDIAKTCAWETRVVRAYGRDQVKHVAEVTCLWYGSFKATPVRLILSRDQDTAEGYDLALVTTDMTAAPAALAARYAGRWEIEQAFGDARNVLGAGEARNRVKKAVERTIPFAMLVSSIVVIWYARHGHDPADIDNRREDQPWYTAKTEPAFEDMLAKLRRVLITARISGGSAAQPTPEEIRAVTAAWTAAAA
jgi:SRSO17 transposase